MGVLARSLYEVYARGDHKVGKPRAARDRISSGKREFPAPSRLIFNSNPPSERTNVRMPTIKLPLTLFIQELLKIPKFEG